MLRTLRMCLFFLAVMLGFGNAHAGMQTEKVYHSVEPGQYLVMIAAAHPGEKWREIAKANNISSPWIIQPKQRLLLPRASRVTAVAQAPAPAPVVVAVAVPQKKEVSTETFRMSEVVVTPSGPAHVFDGMNVSAITPALAIQKLFPEVSEEVRIGLLTAVRGSDRVSTSINVGDTMERLLTADGKVWSGVLQAQASNVALRANCYRYAEPNSGTTFQLLEEMSSRNWYRETHLQNNVDNSRCTTPELDDMGH